MIPIKSQEFVSVRSNDIVIIDVMETCYPTLTTSPLSMNALQTLQESKSWNSTAISPPYMVPSPGEGVNALNPSFIPTQSLIIFLSFIYFMALGIKYRALHN